jgi:hypothetical protein
MQKHAVTTTPKTILKKPSAPLRAPSTTQPTLEQTCSMLGPSIDEIVAQKTAAPSNETQESLRAIARDINERITHFRAIGWELHHDGLHEPTPLTISQTDAPATVTIEGSRFFLDVGDTRQYNQLIKRLGGHWMSYKRAWQFDSLDRLPQVKGSFVVTEQARPRPAASYAAAAAAASAPAVDPGVILVTIVGDFVQVSGDTRPIKDELKAVAPLIRFNGEGPHWTAKIAQKDAIEAKLAELVEARRLKSYSVVESDE